jgi:hypothetical protein
MKTEKPELTPFDRFRDLAGRLITVPRAEVVKKEAEWKKGRAKRKRGPGKKA